MLVIDSEAKVNLMDIGLGHFFLNRKFVLQVVFLPETFALMNNCLGKFNFSLDSTSMSTLLYLRYFKSWCFRPVGLFLKPSLIPCLRLFTIAEKSIQTKNS